MVPFSLSCCFIVSYKESVHVEVHADDGIVFQLLSGKEDFVGENKFDASLLQATGGGTGGEGKTVKDTAASKLNKVSYKIINKMAAVSISVLR